jgi:hypothetical protein
MTATKAKFGDERLDVIKFLCKDFWIEWFGMFSIQACMCA